MMRRIVAFMLVIVLVHAGVTAYAAKSSYSVTIDEANQVVSVYRDGVRIKRFICSTSKYNNFAFGTYKLNGQRSLWTTSYDFKHELLFFTRITGRIGFHAVPYFKRNRGTLDTAEYNRLGTRASAGCIRLLARDAKWIYDNLPSGATVRMTRGVYDSKIKNAVSFPKLNPKYHWDPTDPASNNPTRK